MGRHSCCNRQQVRRGLWSPEEDEKLFNYISTYGHGCWSSVPRLAGLQRCGKSCRLRWINYLRPDLKRGNFSLEEVSLILKLHRVLGNRWSQIAKHLPGRTDNEVKNFWNSSIKKNLFSPAVPQLATIHDISNLPFGFNEAMLPVTFNPDFLMDTQQEHFQLPNTISVFQSSNSSDFQPELNYLGMTPMMLQNVSQPIGTQECSVDPLLGYTIVDCKLTSTAFSDSDPMTMPKMPLDLEMNECTGLPSLSSASPSGAKHEVDHPGTAGLASLTSGLSYPCIPTNQVDYIAATHMPSSSSSSATSGLLYMNPNLQLSSSWIP